MENPHWAGPPEEAIPYPGELRRADQAAGARDGRRKLLNPLLERLGREVTEQRTFDDVLDATPPPETAYLAMLAGEEFDRITAERLSRDADLVRLTEGQGQAAQRRDAFARELVKADERLAKAVADCDRPLTKEDLRRGPAETDPVSHPDALIERRRETRRENVRIRAERVRETVHALLDEQIQAFALLDEQLRLRPQVARARALRLHQHYTRRRAAYLTGLLARHSSPGVLNLLLNLSAHELPDWVRDDKEERK